MIPTRFLTKCEFCSNDLDIREEGSHQYTTGWVMVRQGGGGHGISLPKRENRWAHRYCVERESKGRGSQQQLFG